MLDAAPRPIPSASISTSASLVNLRRQATLIGAGQAAVLEPLATTAE